MILNEWQQSVLSIIANLGGDEMLTKYNNTKEHRTIKLSVPRRIGKSTLIAVLAEQYSDCLIIVEHENLKRYYPEHIQSKIVDVSTFNSKVLQTNLDCILFDEVRSLNDEALEKYITTNQNKDLFIVDLSTGR